MGPSGIPGWGTDDTPAPAWGPWACGWPGYAGLHLSVPPVHLAILLYTSVLAFCALYAPQPLLPLLSSEFGVNPDRASLLIGLTLLPLGVAPVFYGFILESFPALRLLRTSVLLLALSELPILWTDSFELLLAVRLLQGLLLPALLTAVTTYLSTASRPDSVRRVLAWYVAATILGGFLGRLLSGAMGSWLDWRYSFALIMLGLAGAWLLLGRLGNDTRLHLLRPNLGSVKRVLLHPVFSKAYAIIFLVFFCFASLLNLLPFRLSSLQPEVSAFTIGLSYAGYASGLVVALAAARIARWCGGETRAIIRGLQVFALATLLFGLPSLALAFVAMFVFCAGMFLVHATLAGHLNHLAGGSKGLVNGLYISVYYLGGSLGAYLPVGLYQTSGWGAYLALVLGLVSTALALALWLRRIEARC